MKASLVNVVLFFLLMAAGGLPAEENITVLASIDGADQLLQQAFEAELDGDLDRRNKLLDHALESFPDHSGIRWQSGYLKLDGQWVTAEQAEQDANVQGKLSRYRQLRDGAPRSMPAEIALARWCREQGLEEQEKFHWINVLSQYDRRHVEARTRLGVRELDGQLMTPEQVEIWQASKRHYRTVWRQWHPRLKRWKLELERTKTPAASKAWQELGELEDPEAIPVAMTVFRDAGPEVQARLVEALGSIDDPRATNALTQFAVYSNSARVRHIAATNLSQRSWYTYVPDLLGQLENSMEVNYSIQSYGLFVSCQLRYKKEDEDSVQLFADNFNSVLPNIRPVGEINGRNGAAAMRAALNRRNDEAARLTAQHFRRVRASVQAVQRQNLAIQTRNHRVHQAICTATGLDLDSEPQSLWNWWKDYNDYERPESKPLVYQTRSQTRYSPEILLRTRKECFAAGTEVWTETGATAIEQIRRGDRVLSQDPVTGELGYRFVAQVTSRDDVETLQIQAGDQEFVVTQGHPFWVVGQGWKMAREIEIGDCLRRLHGVVQVEDKQDGPETEVFNLIVPDTHSYFVGSDRLLVHDATLRSAASPPLPGWVQQTPIIAPNAPENDNRFLKFDLLRVSFQ